MLKRDSSFSILDIFKGDNLRSFGSGLVLLGLAFVFEHFADVYALSWSLRPTSTYVGDLLLDNLPVINLNFLIIECVLVAIVVGVIFAIIYRPRYILFGMKAVALLIITRAFFISLTHVGIYPAHIEPGVGIFDSIYLYLNFNTGFFFSGHTSVPFLIALIFWERLPERVVALTVSAVLGIAVLLAHIHYSIDVFAAPFMATGSSISRAVSSRVTTLLCDPVRVRVRLSYQM